jgi:hypothetical protein
VRGGRPAYDGDEGGEGREGHREHADLMGRMSMRSRSLGTTTVVWQPSTTASWSRPPSLEKRTMWRLSMPSGRSEADTDGFSTVRNELEKGLAVGAGASIWSLGVGADNGGGGRG